MDFAKIMALKKDLQRPIHKNREGDSGNQPSQLIKLVKYVAKSPTSHHFRRINLSRQSHAYSGTTPSGLLECCHLLYVAHCFKFFFLCSWFVFARWETCLYMQESEYGVVDRVWDYVQQPSYSCNHAKSDKANCWRRPSHCIAIQSNRGATYSAWKLKSIQVLVTSRRRSVLQETDIHVDQDINTSNMNSIKKKKKRESIPKP